MANAKPIKKTATNRPVKKNLITIMTQTKFKTKTPKACTCESCPMFKDYQDNGRGLCKIFDKVSKRHHALTQDCLSSLPPETEFCQYSENNQDKLIDKNKHHSEWETFIVLGQKYNKGRFDNDESYLNQPDWYIYIASTKQPVPVPFWVAETEICLADQSELIDIAEVF